MTDKKKDLENRLDKLSSELENKKQVSNNTTPNPPSNVSYAFKISAEILAGIFVGLFLGYYTDKIFQTKPLFLIIFLLLGIAGSLLNIYKEINKDIKNG